MTDREIHHQISDLVTAERDLRDQLQAGQIDGTSERARLRALEESLDQCWDLLRQRDALRAVGRNPDEAAVRPAGEVEGYVQ